MGSLAEYKLEPLGTVSICPIWALYQNKIQWFVMGIIYPKHQLSPSVYIKYIAKSMSEVLVNFINYILRPLPTILMSIKSENRPMLSRKLMQNKNRIWKLVVQLFICLLEARVLNWRDFTTKELAKKSDNSSFKTFSGLSDTFITLSLFSNNHTSETQGTTVLVSLHIWVLIRYQFKRWMYGNRQKH